MNVLNSKSVEETSLWKMLNGISGENQSLSQTLALNLKIICDEAAQRMKSFPALHAQYTLHDEVHFVRVTELMFRVMPPEVVQQLNPVEITLLILAAFFHDQGMVLENPEFQALKNLPAFQLHKENWKTEHPNWNDLEARLKARDISDDEREKLRQIENELEAAQFSDYIRETHGERSANFVRETYGKDPRWIVNGRNLADLVAKLCVSHSRPADYLQESNGFRLDESIGTFRVSMVYLALVLRLADILDFDGDRAPDSLYRTIDFRSKVSLTEWAKHKAVSGWIIEPELIRFTMECEHPEYQRAALQFMDWIDDELNAAQIMARNFPASASRYRFALPTSVDRSRIVPKNDAYIYRDLEFSLSRNEVVNLLMTDELYGSPSLCVRELLQNAMDALRHRSAIFERDNGQRWTQGKVTMIHELDEFGHEVVRCTDNGIGMDRQIIEKFLTNVGRSYYRSPHWEQERSSLKLAGVDFDPCAQFGIGFMSCFMLGDQITIETRRFNGEKGLGEPLKVEINGIGGLVIIRKGESNQPVGTTVSIIGRKKPRFLDRKNDKVQLIPTLYAYVLNCDFPVEAETKITEIAGLATIPVGFEKPASQLPRISDEKVLTVEQSFSEINPLLNGVMRADFLLDDEGKLCLKNNEAEWQNNEAMNGPILKMQQPLKPVRWSRQQTSLDGIYVAGYAGREGYEDEKWNAKHIRNYESLKEESIFSYLPPSFNFLLDIRGSIKPSLTPARAPKNGDDRKADYMMAIANLAAARIWKAVLERQDCREDPSLPWILSEIHERHRERNFCFMWLCNQSVFDNIFIPLILKDGTIKWSRMKDLPEFQATPEEEPNNSNFGVKRPFAYSPSFRDGSRAEFGNWFYKWSLFNRQSNSKLKSLWLLADLIGLSSTLNLKGDEIWFKIQEPTDLAEPVIKFLFGFQTDYILAIPYAGCANQFLSVHCPCISANRYHPLTREAANHNFELEPSRFGDLPDELLWLLCHPENEEILIDDGNEMPRWVIEIAHRVLETDWGSASSVLAPPYKVRLLNGVEVTITTETFRRWSQAQPLNDDEKE